MIGSPRFNKPENVRPPGDSKNFEISPEAQLALAHFTLKRPNVYDFLGIQVTRENYYTEEAIEKDMAFVEKKKLEHARKREQSVQPDNNEAAGNSEFLQAALVDQVKNWFEDVVMIMTSEYDDLKGIDLGMRYLATYLGLGLDVTTSQNAQIIRQKFEHLYNGLAAGSISEIKYYHEPDRFRGFIMAPRFLFSVGVEDLKRLDACYSENKHDTITPHLLLHQLSLQCTAIIGAYTKNTELKNRDFILEKYQAVQQILKDLQNQLGEPDDTVRAYIEGHVGTGEIKSQSVILGRKLEDYSNN